MAGAHHITHINTHMKRSWIQEVKEKYWSRRRRVDGWGKGGQCHVGKRQFVKDQRRNVLMEGYF